MGSRWSQAKEPVLIHVGAGIFAPSFVVLREEQIPPNDAGYGLEATVELDGGRYVVESLTITREPGGDAVTGEGLRRVALQDLISVAVAGSVGPRGADGWPVSLSFTDDELSAIRAGGPTDRTLDVVAKLYVLGKLVGNAPAKNVAGVLGIPMPTANNWVRRAKDRGHLGPYKIQEREGAGEPGGSRVVTRYQEDMTPEGERWQTVAEDIRAMEYYPQSPVGVVDQGKAPRTKATVKPHKAHKEAKATTRDSRRG